MNTPILSKSLMVLLLFGFMLSCRQKPADLSVVRSSKYKKSLKEAYSKVGFFYHANLIPGMAVAVSIDNQLVLADGFGYSNFELKAKASPSHKFRIGQVSELMTALTTAKLYEEGKIQLDKPVSEYLPDTLKLPLEYTIRQLGAHSSGIRPENVPAGKGNVHSLETIIPAFIEDSLEYEPGSLSSHTELGFDLIGFLIEKITSEPYAKVVKKTVLDTLNLGSTIPDSPFRITENRSSNYDYDFVAQPMVSAQIDLRGKEASAGYLSSVIDLVKIGNTLLYPGFLKQETIDWLTSPHKMKNGQSSPYSFGMIVSTDRRNRTFYGIRGSVQGGSATLLIYPEDKLVVAIASNISTNSTELPVFDIAEIFMNQLHPELVEEENKEGAVEENPVEAPDPQ